MLRELGVLGLLAWAGVWATGLLDTNPSRLGDRSPESDNMIVPSKQWTPKCEEIITRFEASMSDMSVDKRDLNQAIGQTAKQVVKLRQFENDLNAANCPVNARELNQATQQMSGNGEPSAATIARM